MSSIDRLFSLDGKVAVVLGGSGVLGGAMAQALAAAGAKVGVVYHSGKQRAEQQVSAMEQAGGSALALHADATRKDELEAVKDRVVSEMGAVNILLNAPGINSVTPVLEIEEPEWDRILDINLKGIFLACQVFGAQMIAQGSGGSIINISSVTGHRPLSKVLTYSLSKTGVNALTQYLAREWAHHNIRVNAIAPGFFPAIQNRKILTPERKEAIMSHTPFKRYGEPHELAGAVIWLAASEASSFVTGAIIPVDGGFTAMTI